MGGPTFDAGEENALNKQPEKGAKGHPGKGKLASSPAPARWSRAFEDDHRPKRTIRSHGRSTEAFVPLRGTDHGVRRQRRPARREPPSVHCG